MWKNVNSVWKKPLHYVVESMRKWIKSVNETPARENIPASDTKEIIIGTCSRIWHRTGKHICYPHRRWQNVRISHSKWKQIKRKTIGSLKRRNKNKLHPTKSLTFWKITSKTPCMYLCICVCDVFWYCWIMVLEN